MEILFMANIFRAPLEPRVDGEGTLSRVQDIRGDARVCFGDFNEKFT